MQKGLGLAGADATLEHDAPVVQVDKKLLKLAPQLAAAYEQLVRVYLGYLVGQ